MTEENTEEIVEEKIETKGKPADLPPDEEWDRVDFAKDDPDKIERRFNRLFRQVKETQGALDVAATDNRKLLERLNEREAREANEKTGSRVAELKAQKVKALEDDDHAKVVEIDDEIVTLRSTPEKKPEPVAPQASTWFDTEKQRTLDSWSKETDGDGNLIRPWTQDGHPKNSRATKLMSALLEDPEYTEMEDILKEADRMMGQTKSKPKTAAVLNGDTNRRPKPDKNTKLTREQTLVAKAMGVTPEQYAKGLE